MLNKSKKIVCDKSSHFVSQFSTHLWLRYFCGYKANCNFYILLQRHPQQTDVGIVVIPRRAVCRIVRNPLKGPSTLATLFNHMWPRIVAGIFIPVGNHSFQALASTLQFVAQVCDRLWLVPATDRAFAYITYVSPPHVALVCSGPPQCAATCGWTKWPVCSGPKGGPIISSYTGELVQIANHIVY